MPIHQNEEEMVFFETLTLGRHSFDAIRLRILLIALNGDIWFVWQFREELDTDIPSQMTHCSPIFGSQYENIYM